MRVLVTGGHPVVVGRRGHGAGESVVCGHVGVRYAGAERAVSHVIEWLGV